MLYVCYVKLQSILVRFVNVKKTLLYIRVDHFEMKFMVNFYEFAKSLIKIGMYVGSHLAKFWSVAPVNSGTSAHLAN